MAVSCLRFRGVRGESSCSRLSLKKRTQPYTPKSNTSNCIVAHLRFLVFGFGVGVNLLEPACESRTRVWSPTGSPQQPQEAASRSPARTTFIAYFQYAACCGCSGSEFFKFVNFCHVNLPFCQHLKDVLSE
eukprot:2949645-Rhodomonas_salina.1